MAVPDGKPATSFNAMDREWVRAVAKEAGGLPEVSASDNGDVLTVVSGEWATATPVAELPAVTGSDNGDVLTVVEGAWAKASPVTELPAVTGSDNGNVLTVVEGVWAAAAPSGGGNALYANVSYDSINEQLILDQTWQTIATAMKNKIPVYIYFIVEEAGELSSYFCAYVYYAAEEGTSPDLVYCLYSQPFGAESGLKWTCSSANSYPAFSD